MDSDPFHPHPPPARLAAGKNVPERIVRGDAASEASVLSKSRERDKKGKRAQRADMQTLRRVNSTAKIFSRI